ncbi:MAG TPA: phospholipase D family protein [Gemmatimonadales bacterium]|nr:phospholipase D family protein [Gemmatimonadales bacterium]
MTRLERWIEPRVVANAGPSPGEERSAFRLLSTGIDAFVARAVLIELAERTLDLQYYIFHPDRTGSLIIERLIAAADRGVKVRVLIDDWGTLDKKDESVAGVDGHPNIDVKLFNPYTHRSGLYRLGELLTDFTRVNRRMHNKLFVADGIATILGGRNIGDEYFGVGELDFQDVDVLGAGPVARQATASFEAYWNSALAVPIAQLGKFAPDPDFFPAVQARLHDRCDGLRETIHSRALVDSHLAQELRADDLHVHWAAARVIADPPEKITQPDGQPSDAYLGSQISPSAQATRSKLLVVSPYFVPGTAGVDFFAERRQAGVDVQVLTNSLAATDVWLVHAGYMKYRRPLLEHGVKLYELRPEAAGATKRRASKMTIGSSRASLHGKSFVFDRSSVFIGSLNLDPRSLLHNTEVGVLVTSAELAGEVAALFERWASPDMAYEVTRGRNGGLRWTPGGFTSEPGAGFWRPLGARFFSHLPIDSLI